MAIRDTILPEFDNEMATTRRTLERIPEGKSDWKPHEKSMTLGRLAGHIAELPGMAARALLSDSLDVQASGARPQPLVMTLQKQLLGEFDRNVATARQAISGASDQDLMKSWTMLAGGKTVFSLPRTAVLRTFFLAHVIHHRGQLSVYLRLNNVPVPAIYGPSADENPFS